MTILQAGVPKSGNFWVYRIIEEIIDNSSLERRSWIQRHPIHEIAKTWDLSYEGQADIDVLKVEPNGVFYGIDTIFRYPIENLDDYIRHCSHVWTHSRFCGGSMAVLPKFDKLVYIIRDPRDVAVSMSRFAFTPYMMKYYPHNYETPEGFLQERLDRIVEKWVHHVAGYLKHKNDLNIHVVFYERLLHRFQQTLGSLLDYLDVEVSGETRATIQRVVSYGTMREENPHHVRKGESYQWAHELSDKQQSRVREIARPMLCLLNYPGKREALSQGVVPLPYVPSGLGEAKVDEAMEVKPHSSDRGRVVRLARKALASLLSLMRTVGR